MARRARIQLRLYGARAAGGDLTAGLSVHKVSPKNYSVKYTIAFEKGSPGRFLVAQAPSPCIRTGASRGSPFIPYPPGAKKPMLRGQAEPRPPAKTPPETYNFPCLLYFAWVLRITLISFFPASLILLNCSIWTFAPGISFRCSEILSRTRPL